LRKNTGQNRMDSSGARHTLCTFMGDITLDDITHPP